MQYLVTLAREVGTKKKKQKQKKSFLWICSLNTVQLSEIKS